jgi:hypothetical protein
MADPGKPLILYVPGLLPKPQPEVHYGALQRCLLAGIRHIDETVADDIEAEQAFEIVPWTFDFYGSHRNFAMDAAGIDVLLQQHQASPKDIREAGSWKRRFTRWLYHLGNRMPFLIPHLASERLEIHLRDLRRYVHNQRGIAERIRHKVKTPLRMAHEAGRPILLIGHSMGSVIAYDALWQMSHRDNDDVRIDLLLTMGSPLGQDYILERVQGSGRDGAEKYPANVLSWKNLSAIGDLTAIDPELANDFAPMLEVESLQRLEDERIFTWYRLEGELNVHAEYGYLVNEVTARVVSEWWSRVRSLRASA